MPEHRDLKEIDGLHEPKGVEAAPSGQVYVSNGSGSGLWTNSLESKPNILEAGFRPTSEVPVSASNSPVRITSTYGTWQPEDITGDMTIDANGRITFNTAGWYRIYISGLTSPNTNLGSDNEKSAIQLWDNGVGPDVDSAATIIYIHHRDTTARDVAPFSFSRAAKITAGQTLDFYHIALDNSTDMWYDRITVSLQQVGV